MAAGLTARRRPPDAARLVAGLAALVLVALAPAACAQTASAPPAVQPSAVASLGPSRNVGPAVAQTRAELVRVLGTRNLVLQDSSAAFRPPEDSRFTGTPRALYQVILPDAPSEGFIVVYEFGDPTAAAEAATAQAAYLATGPAKVQSAFGARHVLRLVGSTVVLYSWVPTGVEDPRQPEIQAALETLGTGVPVPS
jgi:hypothetical protein